MSSELAIGYYDPFDLFPLIKPSLDAKLPLTNLHWRPRTNNTFKSIAKLAVNLVEEVPRVVPSVDPKQNVYARLMFIKQTNIDTYKSQVRPLIKEWLKHLVHPDDTEWMIVLYIPIQTKEKVSNLIKTSILDKLGADFGKDGKQLPLLNMDAGDVERCFKLKEYNDKEVNKLEIYNDLVNSLKNLILGTFENKHNHVNQKLKLTNTIDRHYLRLLLAKAALFSDLNLFKESLEVYQDASEAVKSFCTTNLDVLDSSFPRLDLSNFTVEKLASKIKVDQLLQDEKISLFSLNFELFNRKTGMFFHFIKSENLVSINAIHISNLFQTLLLFLNDLTHKFGDASAELNYALIDYYLSLSPITNVFNLNAEEVNLSNILEFRGDLRLFQRSQLVKLGREDGFYSKALAGILHDVALEEVPYQNVDVTYEPLKRVLKTEETYIDRFEWLTELVIQDFVSCGRSKSIDILSIDLAMSKYEKKDYKEALNILQDSHEFFIESGWYYMGGTLLIVYLDCIKHMNIENPPLLLKTYLKLFSNLKARGSYIDGNNFRAPKTSEQIQDIFTNIFTLSNEVSEPLEYPVDKFFSIDLHPFIFKDDSTDLDTYCLEVRIDNVFGSQFEFDSIEVMMVCGLKFTTHKVKVSSSKTAVIRLYSNDFISGRVQPERLVVNVSTNLSFVHSFIQAPSMDETVVHHNSILDDSVVNSTTEQPNIEAEIPQLLFYESSSAFNSELQLPQSTTLGQTQFAFKIRNGRSQIQKIAVELASEDPNLKLKKKKLELPGVSLSAGEEFVIDVPYLHTGDNKLLTVDLKVAYEASSQTFTYIKQVSLDTSLTLSVSVHDIFKANFVFSKFQISAVNSSYSIRILDSILENNNDNYQVHAPQNLPKNQIVFNEQPYSSFYKICPKKSYRKSSMDSFILMINYSNLAEECIAYIEKKAKPLFEDAGLDCYWCLFNKTVLQQLKIDTKATVASKKMTVENISDYSRLLEDAIVHISKPQQRTAFSETAMKCLKEAQDNIELTPVPKTLKISVPVPNIDILQVINFDYIHKSYYLVGEPIQVTAEIDSITRWSNKATSNEDVSIIAESSPTRVPSTKTHKYDDFQLILVGDENWLISGFKRKNFTIDFEADFTHGLVHFTMTPLVVGQLSLPKVIIKVQNEKNYTMDITVKNGTESLLVVPELDNIVFSF